MKWTYKVSLIILGVWAYIIGSSILLDLIFDSTLFSADYGSNLTTIIFIIILCIIIFYNTYKMIKRTDEEINNTYNISRKKYYIIALILWILQNTVFCMLIFDSSFAKLIKLDKLIEMDGLVMILFSIITLVITPILSIIIIKIKDSITKKS